MTGSLVLSYSFEHGFRIESDTTADQSVPAKWKLTKTVAGCELVAFDGESTLTVIISSVDSTPQLLVVYSPICSYIRLRTPKVSAGATEDEIGTAVTRAIASLFNQDEPKSSAEKTPQNRFRRLTRRMHALAKEVGLNERLENRVHRMLDELNKVVEG